MNVRTLALKEWYLTIDSVAPASTTSTSPTYPAHSEPGHAKLREASKTQQNVITERRAPRKYKKSAKQKRERKPPKTTNADAPLVILPTRVRSKFPTKNQDLLHGNIDVSTMFKTIRIGAKRTGISAVLTSRWGAFL